MVPVMMEPCVLPENSKMSDNREQPIAQGETQQNSGATLPPSHRPCELVTERSGQISQGDHDPQNTNKIDDVPITIGKTIDSEKTADEDDEDMSGENSSQCSQYSTSEESSANDSQDTGQSEDMNTMTTHNKCVKENDDAFLGKTDEALQSSNVIADQRRTLMADNFQYYDNQSFDLNNNNIKQPVNYVKEDGNEHANENSVLRESVRQASENVDFKCDIGQRTESTNENIDGRESYIKHTNENFELKDGIGSTDVNKERTDEAKQREDKAGDLEAKGGEEEAEAEKLQAIIQGEDTESEETGSSMTVLSPITSQDSMTTSSASPLADLEVGLQDVYSTLERIAKESSQQQTGVDEANSNGMHSGGIYSSSVDASWLNPSQTATQPMPTSWLNPSQTVPQTSWLNPSQTVPQTSWLNPSQTVPQPLPTFSELASLLNCGKKTSYPVTTNDYYTAQASSMYSSAPNLYGAAPITPAASSYSLTAPSYDTATSSYSTAAPSYNTAAPSYNTAGSSVTPVASYSSSVAAYNVATPAYSVATPAYSVATPAYSVATPAYSVATPAYSMVTTAYNVATPANSVATLAYSAATPADSVATQTYNVATQAYSVATPAYSVTPPAYSVATPAYSAATPVYSSSMSMYGSAASVYGSVYGGGSSYYPQQPHTITSATPPATPSATTECGHNQVTSQGQAGQCNSQRRYDPFWSSGRPSPATSPSWYDGTLPPGASPPVLMTPSPTAPFYSHDTYRENQAVDFYGKPPDNRLKRCSSFDSGTGMEFDSESLDFEFLRSSMTGDPSSMQWVGQDVSSIRNSTPLSLSLLAELNLPPLSSYQDYRTAMYNSGMGSLMSTKAMPTVTAPSHVSRTFSPLTIQVPLSAHSSLATPGGTTSLLTPGTTTTSTSNSTTPRTGQVFYLQPLQPVRYPIQNVLMPLSVQTSPGVSAQTIRHSNIGTAKKVVPVGIDTPPPWPSRNVSSHSRTPNQQYSQSVFHPAPGTQSCTGYPMASPVLQPSQRHQVPSAPYSYKQNTGYTRFPCPSPAATHQLPQGSGVSVHEALKVPRMKPSSQESSCTVIMAEVNRGRGLAKHTQMLFKNPSEPMVGEPQLYGASSIRSRSQQQNHIDVPLTPGPGLQCVASSTPLKAVEAAGVNDVKRVIGERVRKHITATNSCSSIVPGNATLSLPVTKQNSMPETSSESIVSHSRMTPGGRVNETPEAGGKNATFSWQAHNTNSLTVLTGDDLSGKTPVSAALPRMLPSDININKPRHFDLLELQIGSFKRSWPVDQDLVKAKLKLLFGKRKLLYELEVLDPETTGIIQNSVLVYIEIALAKIIGLATSKQCMVLEMTIPPTASALQRTYSTSGGNRRMIKNTPIAIPQNLCFTDLEPQLKIAPYHWITFTSEAGETVRDCLIRFDDYFHAIQKTPLVVDPHKVLVRSDHPSSQAPPSESFRSGQSKTLSKRLKGGTRCSCGKGCLFSRCSCIKQLQQCTSRCHCISRIDHCANPLNQLAECGVDVQAAKNDPCLIEMGFKVRNMKDVLNEMIALPCCHQVAKLVEVVPGRTRCPRGCEVYFQYSWCHEVLYKDEGPGRIHCSICNICQHIGGKHCQTCNRCFTPSENSPLCPCTSTKMAGSQLNITSLNPSLTFVHPQYKRSRSYPFGNSAAPLPCLKSSFIRPASKMCLPPGDTTVMHKEGTTQAEPVISSTPGGTAAPSHPVTSIQDHGYSHSKICQKVNLEETSKNDSWNKGTGCGLKLKTPRRKASAGSSNFLSAFLAAQDEEDGEEEEGISDDLEPSDKDPEWIGSPGCSKVGHRKDPTDGKKHRRPPTKRALFKKQIPRKTPSCDGFIDEKDFLCLELLEDDTNEIKEKEGNQKQDQKVDFVGDVESQVEIFPETSKSYRQVSSLYQQLPKGSEHLLKCDAGNTPQEAPPCMVEVDMQPSPVEVTMYGPSAASHTTSSSGPLRLSSSNNYPTDTSSAGLLRLLGNDVQPVSSATSTEQPLNTSKDYLLLQTNSMYNIAVRMAMPLKPFEGLHHNVISSPKISLKKPLQTSGTPSLGNVSGGDVRARYFITDEGEMTTSESSLTTTENERSKEDKDKCLVNAPNDIEMPGEEFLVCPETGHWKPRNDYITEDDKSKTEYISNKENEGLEEVGRELNDKTDNERQEANKSQGKMADNGAEDSTISISLSLVEEGVPDSCSRHPVLTKQLNSLPKHGETSAAYHLRSSQQEASIPVRRTRQRSSSNECIIKSPVYSKGDQTAQEGKVTSVKRLNSPKQKHGTNRKVLLPERSIDAEKDYTQGRNACPANKNVTEFVVSCNRKDGTFTSPEKKAQVSGYGKGSQISVNSPIQENKPEVQGTKKSKKILGRGSSPKTKKQVLGCKKYRKSTSCEKKGEISGIRKGSKFPGRGPVPKKKTEESGEQKGSSKLSGRQKKRQELQTIQKINSQKVECPEYHIGDSIPVESPSLKGGSEGTDKAKAGGTSKTRKHNQTNGSQKDNRIQSLNPEKSCVSEVQHPSELPYEALVPERFYKTCRPILSASHLLVSRKRTWTQSLGPEGALQHTQDDSLPIDLSTTSKLRSPRPTKSAMGMQSPGQEASIGDVLSGGGFDCSSTESAAKESSLQFLPAAEPSFQTTHIESVLKEDCAFPSTPKRPQGGATAVLGKPLKASSPFPTRRSKRIRRIQKTSPQQSGERF